MIFLVLARMIGSILLLAQHVESFHQVMTTFDAVSANASNGRYTGEAFEKQHGEPRNVSSDSEAAVRHPLLIRLLLPRLISPKLKGGPCGTLLHSTARRLVQRWQDSRH